MNWFPNIFDPHEIPFAPPLVIAAGLGFIIAYIILRLMDRVIKQEQSDK
jgi:phosphate/sulfate permease